MTYTTVHKTYQAETLAQAGAMMLLDEAIWKLEGILPPADLHERPTRERFDEAVSYPKVAGEPQGYSVESWEWDAEKHELTVNFR